MNKTKTKTLTLTLSGALLLAACGSEVVSDATDVVEEATTTTTEQVEVIEEETTTTTEAEIEETEEDILDTISFDFTGLEPLGEDFVYEGWVVIDGAPVSTGRFILTPDGEQEFLSESLVDDLSEATTAVISIEPAVGDDPAPADPKPLAGDIVDGVAELNAYHPAALGTDFEGYGGQFVLATPTSASEDDEYSGVWFIDIEDGVATQGLDLPELPAGWEYEGWVVVDGTPLSTGKFTTPDGPDDFDGFSGVDGDGPPFPGEDFIENAPEGLDFPLDIRGSDVVLSIEPVEDDSPAPFAFKPFAANIPEDIEDHVGIELGEGPAFPVGTAIISN